LAPTAGIAATGFCYPGRILQLFSSARSTNLAAADSSSQIASSHLVFIINNSNAEQIDAASMAYSSEQKF
jgi:hypothetical protein